MKYLSRYGWRLVLLILAGLLLVAAIRLILFSGSNGQATNTPGATATHPGSPVSIATNTPTQQIQAPRPYQQVLSLSSDPYTNSGSQHQTEVEPGSYSYGSTIVIAFQAGRFQSHGSTNIGWATSLDNGTTWQNGFMTGTTKIAGGRFDRITDPTVSYSARYHTWIIASVALQETTGGTMAVAVLVSLSTNGGTAWNEPIVVSETNGFDGGFDKDWIACDNSNKSTFYGNCYLEWDSYTRGSLIQMSTSSDGGQTWGAAQTTVGQASGFSGYPLIQPDGNIIVPISNANQTAIMVFSSNDGGKSWSDPVKITSVTSFSANAYFQDNILLTVQSDTSGKLYLVWVDCRFEPQCTGNDLAMTTSTDGTSWTPVERIPLTAIDKGINYYVTALGVDMLTSGIQTHLALIFYYYAANCSADCSLYIGFASSTNDGQHWNTVMPLLGPLPASWIANGNNKVGDYISLSFANGKAFPFFSYSSAPSAGKLHEGMYTINQGLSL